MSRLEDVAAFNSESEERTDYSNNHNIKEIFIQVVYDNKFTMYKIAKGILKSQEDMDDAIGDTILKSFSSLNNLKDRNSIKAWIFWILINQCYDIAKKNSREILTAEVTKDIGFYESGYRDLELSEVINQLEENLRVVTILFYYDDMSIKDIAGILDLPEGTVKSRLARAKRNLKEIIKDRI